MTGTHRRMSLRKDLKLRSEMPGDSRRKMNQTAERAAGTGSSVVIESCQVCGHSPLDPVLFLGYMPPVNQMRRIGEIPREQPSYPTQLLLCPSCQLVQLGLSVDPAILFPPDYPYTSGTTRMLRENFAQLKQEADHIVGLGPSDLVIDIGSNDGTLLSNFLQGGHRVLGIEPTDVGETANERGIETLRVFFRPEVGEQVRSSHGPAKVVTAANVFAHMEDVHPIVDGIVTLLDEGGVFVSESHYLISLLKTLQYDTIYHEHLRYYSLHSIKYLLEMHGLEVFFAREIPTHGGSIRVYAARRGLRAPHPSVAELLAAEPVDGALRQSLADFRKRVVLSKLSLHALLSSVKSVGDRIFGVSAPSRASTLVNYVGLDDGILDCVVEIKGSLKIGKYLPGTIVPVVEESYLFEEQPEHALILSWHIAEEIAPKLREKGFRGRFIVPLPEPRIL